MGPKLEKSSETVCLFCETFEKMEELGVTNIFSYNMFIFEIINTPKCYVGLHS